MYHLYHTTSLFMPPQPFLFAFSHGFLKKKKLPTFHTQFTRQKYIKNHEHATKNFFGNKKKLLREFYIDLPDIYQKYDFELDNYYDDYDKYLDLAEDIEHQDIFSPGALNKTLWNHFLFKTLNPIYIFVSIHESNIYYFFGFIVFL